MKPLEYSEAKMKALVFGVGVTLVILVFWLVNHALDYNEHVASKRFDYDITCEMAGSKMFYSLGNQPGGSFERGLFGGEVIYIWKTSSGHNYYMPASKCVVVEKETK